MRRLSLSVLSLAIILSTSWAHAEQLLGTTNFGPFTLLVGVDSKSPFLPNSVQWISGLTGTERIVGLDARASDKVVYVLATSPGTAGTSSIYRLEPISGKLTKVVGPLDPALEKVNGTSFGFDIDPVSGRARIVSDTNQNLRVSLSTGAVTTDPKLAYLLGDDHYGTDPNVVHIACSNNVDGAASTQIYAIDSELGILAKMNSTTGKLTTVGDLGIDVDEIGGFDIAGSGKAYAALAPGGFQSLYEIDLETGKAKSLGVAVLGFFRLQGLTAIEFPED